MTDVSAGAGRDGRLQELVELVIQRGRVVHTPPGAVIGHDGFDPQCQFCRTEVIKLAAILAVPDPLASDTGQQIEIGNHHESRSPDGDGPVSRSIPADSACEPRSHEAGSEPADSHHLTDSLVRLVKMARCEHVSRSGGNDYHLCDDCGLMWDYRKESPNDGLVNFLKLQPLAAPLASSSEPQGEKD